MRVPLIGLLCATMFTSVVWMGAFAALLPDLGRSAGLADWQLGTVAGAFGFARMVADVPVGLFITHHLRRAVVLSPVLVAAGLLCLVSGGPFVVLVVGRALMGIGHAFGVVAGLTAILRYQSTGALASALSAFELSAMVGILAGTAGLALLPPGLDWNIALLLVCTPQFFALLLTPLVLAALPAEPRGAPAPLFARRATPAPVPVTGLVVLAFAAGAAIATSYATLEQFVIPLRGDREFALGRAGIARLLMTVQVFDIVCLLPAGLLSDRRGARRVLGAMLLIFAVGEALVAFGDLPAVVAGCALFGVGMAAWTLPLSLLRRETPPDHVGWRTALYRVGVDAGIFLGPFLSGFAGAGSRLLAGGLGLILALIGLGLLRRRH